MNEPYTPNIATLAANLKHASWEGSNVVIGGGVFTPKELQNGARALAAFPDLLEALQWFELQMLDDACDDMAQLLDDMRSKCLAAIAKATGVEK